MPNRKKLIELIMQSTQKCASTDCNRCKYWNTNDCGAARMADILIKNGVVVLPCNADEYISKSEVARYIGIMFANAMQKNNDVPPCRNPSDYLSGYSDGIKKALDTVQNFEATVVIKDKGFEQPTPADPGVYVPIRKPIEAPEGPPIVKPIPSSEDILPKKVLGDYSPLSFTAPLSFRFPKEIATIKICGATEIHITEDTKGFIKPTPEQIKNLKEMLCIDVELLEEEK